ncbi:hypothetical protein KAM622c_45590 [Klebsiella quasipneumoniae subsp. quasipneumoniae]|nr:hypothetical protein KAM622c_45590 [Klebsiella quasipneumoniae subsp. quasipneumoniae]
MALMLLPLKALTSCPCIHLMHSGLLQLTQNPVPNAKLTLELRRRGKHCMQDATH